MGTNEQRGGRIADGCAWILIPDRDAAIALGAYLHRQKPEIRQQTYIEASEALERALVEPAPDVLVIRYAVGPTGTAERVLRQMRNIDKFARVPCILLARTGEISRAERPTLAALGAISRLAMPVDDDPTLAELVGWFCAKPNPER